MTPPHYVMVKYSVDALAKPDVLVVSLNWTFTSIQRCKITSFSTKENIGHVPSYSEQSEQTIIFLHTLHFTIHVDDIFSLLN